MDVSQPRVRADAHDEFHMARRTCFREQYYTGTRRYFTARDEGRVRPGETKYTFVMVFLEYLWMHVFVWARVFCGTRYYQSASVDCSGTIQKIHIRKIRRGQGIVHDGHVADIMIRGRLTREN